MTRQLRILGLSAKKGGGKDTVCEFLRGNQAVLFPGWTVLRRGIADPIKDILNRDFGVPYELLHGDDLAKDSHLPRGNPGVTVRQAAQQIGSAYTELDDTHWVRRFARWVETSASHTSPLFVICTDVRFPKEVELIRGKGGRVFRLTRGRTDDTHVSETALDGYADFDAVIPNHAMSIAEANAAVLMALKTEGWFDGLRDCA